MTLQDIQGNSATNQHIKGKLVEREVICNMTEEVEFILNVAEEHHQDAPYSWDDVHNIYSVDRDILTNFIDDTLTEKDVDEMLDELAAETIDEIDTDNLKNYLEQYHEFEVPRQEIFEWWYVSWFLGEKLKEYGEPVIESFGGQPWVWGRCATGQSIVLDYVITKIAFDMEILEGQKYDWSK